MCSPRTAECSGTAPRNVLREQRKYGRKGKEISSVPTSFERQQEIIMWVDEILAKAQDDIHANIKEQEDKIDILVYHLYDLTYDEILIVDPDTPITKEEYEVI